VYIVNNLRISYNVIHTLILNF